MLTDTISHRKSSVNLGFLREHGFSVSKKAVVTQGDSDSL